MDRKGMTQCQTFPSPEAIREWAGTPSYKKVGEVICVQYRKDKLFYYFALEAGEWIFKMNSINYIGE